MRLDRDMFLTLPLSQMYFIVFTLNDNIYETLSLNDTHVYDVNI